jgi:hypothetical protein
LIQQLTVVHRRQLQTIDRDAKRCSLRRTKLAVLEIEVVNDFTDACDRGIADAKADCERLKRAAIPFATETYAEHIEGKRIASGLDVGDESKPRVGIDEPDFERAVMEHGALKFQAGTPDVAGPVGLAAAIDFLTTLGKDATWRHDQDLVRHGLTRLREVKGLRIIGSSSAQDRVPVFTFAVEGKSPVAIAAALDSRGVAIRAGDMAALPLLKRFGVS